jgi:hypothetical protein
MVYSSHAELRKHLPTLDVVAAEKIVSCAEVGLFVIALDIY